MQKEEIKNKNYDCDAIQHIFQLFISILIMIAIFGDNELYSSIASEKSSLAILC